jgi:hypothetical protein
MLRGGAVVEDKLYVFGGENPETEAKSRELWVFDASRVYQATNHGSWQEVTPQWSVDDNIPTSQVAGAPNARVNSTHGCTCKPQSKNKETRVSSLAICFILGGLK